MPELRVVELRICRARRRFGRSVERFCGILWVLVGRLDTAWFFASWVLWFLGLGLRKEVG